MEVLKAKDVDQAVRKGYTGGSNPNHNHNPKSIVSTFTPNKNTTNTTSGVTPSKPQSTVQPHPVSATKKPMFGGVDGFFITKKRPTTSTSTGTSDNDKNKKLKTVVKVVHPIHFRFSKGCTNAVRRTVHINEFC